MALAPSDSTVAFPVLIASAFASPLVFPTEEMEGKFRDYYTFKDIDDYNEYSSIFDPIVQS